MKIDRVIFSSDTTEKYLQFWPLICDAWIRLMNVQPVFVLVMDKRKGREEEERISTSIKERIRSSIVFGPNVEFIPIWCNPEFPAAQQAQLIRFYAATLFDTSIKTEVCLLSDIDMLPLNPSYFHDPVLTLDNSKLVIYSSDAYKTKPEEGFPICYMAGTGTTFGEVIGGTWNNFHDQIGSWLEHGFGWRTDEKVFWLKWKEWKGKDDRTILLNRGFSGFRTIDRIDRAGNIPVKMIEEGYYKDFHMPRPYQKYQQGIDQVYLTRLRSLNIT